MNADRVKTVPMGASGLLCAPTLLRSVLLASMVALPAPALADGQPGPSTGAESTAGSAPQTGYELAPLPEVPPLALPPPTPESVEELARLLDRLTGDDDEDRLAAVAEVRSAHPRLVAAIDRRIDSIAERADRSGMKRLLLDTRGDARDELRKEARAAQKKGKVATPDYLEMVIAHPRVDDRDWQDLVRILALSRMLTAIRTVEAVRCLVRVYVRFDFLRVDTQLQLEKLGDKSVAALIETRRHEAKKIAEWAERQLDLRGKAIPGEAVQTTDYEVLADVLRAYGRIKDPDAARIIISFANSERAQVREAARQAVALLGPVGNWQLSDAYENTVGKKPPRDWSWERTARELFGEYDRLRLARVYELFREAETAHAKGDLKGMRAAYDKVLARNPVFEHGSKMAPGYVEYAVANADTDLEGSITALERALRLMPKGDPQEKRARSLLVALEGERLLKDYGVFDQELFRRAIELDPGNQRARQGFERTQRGDQDSKDTERRWIGAAIIGVLAVIAVLFIGLWPRRRQHEPPTPAPPQLDEATPHPEPPPTHSTAPPEPSLSESASEPPRREGATPESVHDAEPADPTDPASTQVEPEPDRER